MAAGNVALLRGIRVVDLATPLAEMCGRILADLGAEVIKVEPAEGAAARRLAPFAGDNDPQPGSSLYWAAVGLGKSSVVLDLQAQGDREKLRALIDTADIVVESFPPGYLAGLGLGYEELSDSNPGLIYASVSPYGQDGPDASSPASDLTIEAASGLIGLQGDPDRVPVPVGYPQAGFHAGAQAAADAMIALYERERSGRGQYLDVSAQAAVIWTLMNATGYPVCTGTNPPFSSETRKQRREFLPGFDFPGLWQCSDGFIEATIFSGALGGRTLQAIATWIESEGRLSEENRGKNWSNWIGDVMSGKTTAAEVAAICADAKEFFRGKTKREVQSFALRTKSIIGTVFTIADLLEDPQLAARGYWTEIGGRRHPGPFAKLSETPIELGRPAPSLGQDQALLDSLDPRSAAEVSIGATDPAVVVRGQPFDGLKVADFSWVGVGPLVAKALADNGATVVRVETETHPDSIRVAPPYKDGVAGINRSHFWANYNTSKFGLALNLSTPEGPDVARRLVEWADVVIESYVPGTMAKWGLDYASISAGRPDLIMVSTCLRGQTGPEATFTGFGMAGAMLSGINSITGWPDRPPSAPWGAYTDFIVPRYAVAALTSALRHRDQTGRGQYIDISQTEVGIRFIEPLILDYTVNGRVAARPGVRSLNESPHGVFQCVGEERYLALSVTSAEQWRALVRTMELNSFAGSEFEALDARRGRQDEIESAIAAWCREREPLAAVAELKEAGVPAAVVARMTDLYTDPQLSHRGFFVTLDHAEMGPMQWNGPATRFSATPPRQRAAPCLGQDTQYVLSELLNFTDEEVAGLAGAGVLS